VESAVARRGHRTGFAGALVSTNRKQMTTRSERSPTSCELSSRHGHAAPSPDRPVPGTHPAGSTPGKPLGTPTLVGGWAPRVHSLLAVAPSQLKTPQSHPRTDYPVPGSPAVRLTRPASAHSLPLASSLSQHQGSAQLAPWPQHLTTSRESTRTSNMT
jgi:hypothetical protein